jgi:CRISPR system Cascade subunit CasB
MLSSEHLKNTVWRLKRGVEEAGSGELAELRRATPRQPWSGALWRLLGDSLADEAWPTSDSQREQLERRLAALLAAMAASSTLKQGAQPLGAALARAGYSELRLNRLLRASDDKLLDEVRAMAAFMESRSEPIEWSELAKLLVYEPDEERGEHARRFIARRYYNASHSEDAT